MNTHFPSTLFARLHRARACACFLAVAIAGVRAGAQQHVAPPSALPPVTTSGSAAKTPTSAAMLPGAKAAENSDGAHEGIRMHGHWVIDVKNPDGTVAEHRDFENALSGAGAAYLTALMSGYVVPSDYGILAGPVGNNLPPCTPINANFKGCFLVRSLTTSPAVGICQIVPCYAGETYTTNVVGGGQPGSSFKLAGSFTANQDGSIGSVQTYAGTCPNIDSATALATANPATCSTTPGNSGYIYVSGTVLASAISVTSGQIVQVTVTISFS